jgi:hypothetical protein
MPRPGKPVRIQADLDGLLPVLGNTRPDFFVSKAEAGSNPWRRRA